MKRNGQGDKLSAEITAAEVQRILTEDIRTKPIGSAEETALLYEEIQKAF